MILRVGPTLDLQTCLGLRRLVFVDEQGVPENEEIDANDATALHLLAVDSGVPVGTARIVVAQSIGKIGRVCVLKSHRGTGLGKALMREALRQLQEINGVTKAVLGAQTHAIKFYETLGFAVFGEEYMDAGIPHYDMDRPL